MGEEESVTTERPFQSMNAVERTRAKLRICAASCRGWRPATALSIVAVGEEEERREGFRWLLVVVVERVVEVNELTELETCPVRRFKV